MSPSDWILLVTAGIAAWYAWETRIIRKQGQQANTLLNDQLRLIQESQQKDAHRTNSALAPILRPCGTQGGAKKFKFNFKNLGGLVSNASIVVDGGIHSRIFPETIAPNEQGFIKLESKESELPVKGSWTFNYTDSLGGNHSERFSWSRELGIFRKEPAKEV